LLYQVKNNQPKLLSSEGSEEKLQRLVKKSAGINMTHFFSMLGKIIRALRKTRTRLGYKQLKNLRPIQIDLINDLAFPVQSLQEEKDAKRKNFKVAL
jgi:hypothetical protein